MKTSGFIGTVVKQINDEVNASVQNYTKTNKGIVDAALADINKGAETLIDVAKTFVTCTQSESGVFYPSVIVRYVVFEKSNSVEVTIRSKLKADIKTSATSVFKFNDKFLENVTAFFLEQAELMFRKECAVENVTALNERFEQICTENNTPFKVQFAIDGNFISAITDEYVCFGISITQANRIPSLAIVSDTEEDYTAYVANQAKVNFVEAVKAAGTTIAFVKAKEPNIMKITEFSTKMSVHKLIRKSYTKNIEKAKSGVCYYHDKDANVFAIVNKAEDGTITTLLSPFNTETLEKVDVKIG